MDLYLPADFHEIHDAAPDDWRDVSSTSTNRERVQSSPDSPNECADPCWRVF
jgi:hypothetical protein